MDFLNSAPPQKRVTIWVPEDFTVPRLYEATDPETRALALQIGAEAVTLFHDRVKGAALDEQQEQEVAAAVAAAKAPYEAATRRAEEALRVAQFRVEALERAATAGRQEALREAREALGPILAAKEEQIQQLQHTLRQQMELVTSKVDGLHSSLTKTLSSSRDKGQLGETLVESLLRRAFDCDVQAVSKEAQTADIRMTRASGAQYFWEVKNYTRMVNPDEIEKFRRDLRLHPSIRGGALVSLRTGIVGKGRSGDIDMEFLEDGRPILYLSNFLSREDPVFALQGLRPLFDVLEKVAGGTTTQQGGAAGDQSLAVAALQSKALLITNLLKSHELVIGKHRNALAGHRKRMETMFTEFLGYIVESEAQLGAMLRVALGGDEEAAAVQEDSEVALPASLFTKGRLMECGDKRAQDFVKWFVEATKTGEGEQLELRDLFEEARRAGSWGEKWIKGLREDLFKETAWSKGARYMNGVRWRGERGDGSASPPMEI
jgi:hypothetical protein